VGFCSVARTGDGARILSTSHLIFNLFAIIWALISFYFCKFSAKNWTDMLNDVVRGKNRRPKMKDFHVNFFVGGEGSPPYFKD